MHSMLDHIKVLDLSRLLPGPLCSLILADLGAEIIKVEPPGVGDYSRWIPPMHNVEGVGFLSLNRNKKSLSLDLKHPRGKQLFLELVDSTDVLIEGFRPGTMTAMGLDYRTLSAAHPRLVYCSLTGFGQEGPLAMKAGHDLNYLALSGLLGLFSKPGETPLIPPIQLADIGGGSLPAVIAILAALFRREKTGRGEQIDIAMLDGLMLWSSLLTGAFFALGREPRRDEGFLGGATASYNIYKTADGRYLSVGAIEPKFWKVFIHIIDRPDLEEKQFSDGAEGKIAIAEVQHIISSHTLSHWQEKFSGSDACVAPVLTLEEALRQQHLTVRKLLLEFDHPTEGTIRQIGSIFNFSQAATMPDSPPPRLGEHTGEILRGIGLTDEEIQRLKKEGVAG
jgi:crotonobetainyl-CoA:carnitine CoA-transferase CaiB-like acyl-CoA transferase